MDFKVNWNEFFKASNPSLVVDVGMPKDKKYYIDFSSVRGTKVIEEIENTINNSSPDPSCQWFTGHIGCGKSTELLRLKNSLQYNGFYVVFFQSTEHLLLSDINIGAILWIIAFEISKSLVMVDIEVGETAGFKGFLDRIANILNIELQGQIDIPGIAKVNFDSGGVVSLVGGFYKITASIKDNTELGRQFKQFVGSRTHDLLKFINNELLEPAKHKLNKDIVVIVDNLERIPPMSLSTGQTLAEAVFVGGRDLLSNLCCHMVYTVPLELTFSVEHLALGMSPQVLPMVRIKLRDGSNFPNGIEKLREMILVRAFPDIDRADLNDCITRVFDSSKTLDRLCQMSGGHLRQLVRLLYGCLQKKKEPPIIITEDDLEKVIVKERGQLEKIIREEYLNILREISRTKNFIGMARYPELFRGWLVFEYHNPAIWYDINPLLLESHLLFP